MTSDLCDRLGISFPLFGFSHSRDVVAAVTNAGGMGVFGAATLPAEALEAELAWIDDRVEGKPYGVDLIVPDNFLSKGQDISDEALLAMIPQAHKAFADAILRGQGVDTEGLEDARRDSLFFRRNLTPEGAREALEVVFAHPIGLVANALGVPPPLMLEMGRAHGVAVAALVGAADHALRQADAGVDILVASGTEAGGHTGEVSTMVLVPEIVAALQAADLSRPVLAAGGIATGAQMAAAMAMGGAGAWCGSVWLTTAEAETNPIVKEKMLRARSRDTIRSRSRTGKPSRQLRSPWTDAWEADGPEPLAMPLQSLVAEPALRKLDQLSQSGHKGAADLSTYWVGQAVGLMNRQGSAASVVQDFKSDFLTAYERLGSFLGET